MTRLYIERLIAWVSGLAKMGPTPGKPVLDPKHIGTLLLVLRWAADDCRALGLPVAQQQIEDMRRRLEPGQWPIAPGEWTTLSEEFAKRIRVEAQSRVFLAIPAERTRYFEDDAPVLRYDFPSAEYDLVQANLAYAFGLNTACVFHAMRAAEIALRILARHLKIRPQATIDYEQQGKIIGALKKKIEQLQQKTKGAKKAKLLQLYSEAAIHLEHLKFAWRDDVAHSRSRYEEYDAKKALDATVELLEHLALNKIIERKPGDPIRITS